MTSGQCVAYQRLGRAARPYRRLDRLNLPTVQNGSENETAQMRVRSRLPASTLSHVG